MPLTFIGEILGPGRKTEISIGVNWNWLFYFIIIFLFFDWLLVLYNNELGSNILMFGVIIIGYFFIRILLTYHYYLCELRVKNHTY